MTQKYRQLDSAPFVQKSTAKASYNHQDKNAEVLPNQNCLHGGVSRDPHTSEGGHTAWAAQQRGDHVKVGVQVTQSTQSHVLVSAIVYGRTTTLPQSLLRGEADVK